MSEESVAEPGGTSRLRGIEATKPMLRVVKGNPTEEELAALIAVVAARSASGTPAKPKPRSQWGHPVRAVRGPHRPGPDAWRRSAWA